MDTREIYRLIEERRSELGLSQAAVSELAFNRRDSSAFQALRRGSSPSAQKLEALGQALGLEFYFGPPRSADSQPSVDWTQFDPERTIPHRGVAKCGLDGWGRDDRKRHPLPKPTAINDPSAFFVSSFGPSMVPEGIPSGSFCLVSPSTQAKAGDRVWIMDKSGKAAIKRLIAFKPDSVILRGWQNFDGRARQSSFDEERFNNFIEELYPVVAVYYGQLAAKDIDVDFIEDPMTDGIRSQPEAMAIVAIADHQRDLLPSYPGTFEHLALPTDWFEERSLRAERCRLVVACDAEMAPVVSEGSIAMIDGSDTSVRKPGMHAISIDGQTLIRSLTRVSASKLIVQSLQKNSKAQVVSEREKIEILGRVTFTVHQA